MRPKPPPGGARTGFITKILILNFTFLFFLIITLLISLATEWLGMIYLWPDERTTHAQEVLESEIRYLDGPFHENLFTGNAKVYALKFADVIHTFIFETTKLIDLIAMAKRPAASPDDTFHIKLNEFYAVAEDFIFASSYRVQAFAVKLAMLTMAFPLFILFGIVGLADGLVQRDVRRWCGGRESSFIFGYSKTTVFPTLVGAWIIYLSLPFSVHPNFVILPFAVFFGISLALTSSSFKKYI